MVMNIGDIWWFLKPNKMLNKNSIDQIFSIWSKENPNPKTELNFTNHYTLLVAVVLSAQSTDISVNKATKELFKIADNPKKMIVLGIEKLKNYISKIGLFNNKASNIIKLSKILVEEFNCEVPRDFVKLNSLPGVGRKTAAVVLNCAFGEPLIAVDTHVFRVSNRLGFVRSKNIKEVEEGLPKIIPQKWHQYAHHWMILHGRYTCTARIPKCDSCIISNLCPSFKDFVKNTN